MAKTSKISSSQTKQATAGKSPAGKSTAPSRTKSTRATAKKVDTEVIENGIKGDFVNGKLRCKSLIIDGTKYRTRLNYKFENRKKYEPPDSRKITSIIPGTILKLFVKEGQQVKEGEQMLILEAMKMKNIILFDEDGTVEKIHVKEGERVPKNQLIVELK
ncbi:MAG TPA: acetyl-CoA carboxylase biotin carboxyl carrier protein subunit [Bacteroides sp.]|nr:acetyl-CoA carboxylase biotin carboxyl carrier protein subunit [Bacteroides sp.]